jgi:tetratricopeptide (TPR) repeat protein
MPTSIQAPTAAATARAARRLPDHADLVASLGKAEALLDDGNVADARALAEQVVARAGAPEDTPLRARALLVCGSASYEDAQYEPAYLSASEAYALLLAGDDVIRALEAVGTLAAVYCETGEFDRAVEAAKSGIELSVSRGAPEMTMRLLHSLGQVLHRGGEYPEAIRCLDEAIALYDQLLPAARNQRVRYTTELAFVHHAYGEHLAGHGQTALADEHFLKARAALSTPPANAPAGHTMDDIRSLEARVHLQATWHDWQAARQSAALFLRLARRRQSPRRTLAAAMSALSTLYRARGDIARAIRHQRRSLDILRELGLTTAVKESVQRLAALHAERGAYAEALEWHKQAARLQATETGRNNALRCRLAALERQSKRRGAMAREQLLHSRRMMVIGRLIARIHHAMLRPLQRAHERIGEVARSIEGGQGPSRVVELLREAGVELDQAAALTRQLKLFSYRSAPQVSVLSLEEALRSAWDGLRLFDRPQNWSLSVTHDANGAEVLGDAQRLGILLTILLIELAPQGAGPSGRVICAAVEHHSGSAAVAMTIGVSGDQEVAGEPSLGLALCAEIAQEMEGRLDCEYDGTWVRGYRLTLPFAEGGPPRANPVRP